MKVDIAKLFLNSVFVKANHQNVARELDISVNGRLVDAAIIIKAAELANEQALKHPVIIFHKEK